MTISVQRKKLAIILMFLGFLIFFLTIALKEIIGVWGNLPFNEWGFYYYIIIAGYIYAGLLFLSSIFLRIKYFWARYFVIFFSAIIMIIFPVGTALGWFIIKIVNKDSN